jgi:hypothetical protein
MLSRGIVSLWGLPTLRGGDRGGGKLQVGFILHLSGRGGSGGQDALEKSGASPENGDGNSFGDLPKLQDNSGSGRQHGSPKDQIQGKT